VIDGVLYDDCSRPDRCVDGAFEVKKGS
jgi:hypothetical protein